MVWPCGRILSSLSFSFPHGNNFLMQFSQLLYSHWRSCFGQIWSTSLEQTVPLNLVSRLETVLLDMPMVWNKDSANDCLYIRISLARCLSWHRSLTPHRDNVVLKLGLRQLSLPDMSFNSDRTCNEIETSSTKTFMKMHITNEAFCQTPVLV